MQKLLGIKLDDLKYMLDLEQPEDEQRDDQITDLDQKLIKKFVKLNRIIPGAEEQRRMIAQIDHYLLLVRFEEAGSISFYMPSTFVVRLKKQDLCPKHVDIEKKELLAKWQHCNACYLKHSKNNLMDKLYMGLNNIIGLARDLPKTEYRPYVLGLQFVYCVEIMDQLADDLINPEIKAFYLKVRQVALAVLQRLGEMPDLDVTNVKQPKPQGEVIKSRFMLFNFCGSMPKAVHNSALVESWHNKAQI